MAFPAPFIAAIQTVQDEWVDYNGHLNMAYYNVLFDHATDEALTAVGVGPEYIKATGSSLFTLEAHITYVRELHSGNPVRMTVQFLDYDVKRIHFVQQMFHAGEGWLAAVSENMVMHIDMRAKKSSAFAPNELAMIKAMHQAHQSLAVPPQVGHKIGIPRKS